MLDKQSTCCFSGHRIIPPEQKNMVIEKLHHTVENLIKQNGVKYFGCGGAIGFDTLAGECVLEFKKQYPYIKLILILPCINQSEYWSKDDKARYERLKFFADKVVHTHKGGYFTGCMQKRNHHMIDFSGYLVCYMTKANGGTADSYTYAASKNLEIINLNDI